MLNSRYGESVKVEVTEGIATVTIDRGGVNKNALNQDVLIGLTRVAQALEEELAVHAVVLSGRQDIFSAGIDLKDPSKWIEEATDLVSRRSVAQRGARLCRLWQNVPQLTVAALEGPVVGGAAALTLACDWRVGGAGSFFLIPEAGVGLNLGWGAIPRLVRLVGPAMAKQMILLQRRMSTQRALEIGLLDATCEAGSALLTAKKMAASALAGCGGALVRMTKEAVDVAAHVLDHAVSYMDADQALVCRDSEEGGSARRRFLKK